MTNKLLVYGFLLVLIFFAEGVQAQREPVYVDALIGDSIKTGKRLAVKDTVFYDPVLKPTIKNTYEINNLISLQINEGLNKVLPDSFILSVKLKIIYTAPDTLSDSIPEKILTINYNKNGPYNNKAVFYFKTAHYVELKILEITSSYADTATTIPLVLLENRMVIERDYLVNCTDNAIDSISRDTSAISSVGELKISWTPNLVSQMYDVEWTYIDQSAISSGRYNTDGHLDPALLFVDNATRITTKEDTCMIPLLYDGDGILFYRVRGVQANEAGELQTTRWSSEADTTTANWKYVFTGHERPLNWQASTTFAEEGKRKSVVQYFDGSLRARQVVTRDNTTGTTVVAETLYDKQGRPSIQIMPAPTLSTLIKYTPGFNVKDMNGAEYDKGVYDTLLVGAEYCGAGSDSMSVSNGAARYYSNSNPLKDEGFHKFVPKDSGFVFTETRYTQDNTGRIFSQSGIGKYFRLGSGKETRYYYGSADQADLDALFGTEVGEASHYQKNMVRDANGQYSVSYVDMHGRTIATALAGAAPGSLDTIRSYRRDSLESEQVLNKNTNLVNGNSVDFSKSIFMTRNDSVWLHYSMGKKSLKLEDCRADSICYDCLYDLTISVTGECSGSVSGRADTVITMQNFSLWRVDTTCGLAEPIDITIGLFLLEGSYNITKKLSINQQGLEKYRDSVYLTHNTCSNYDSIYRRQMKFIKDSLDCNVDTLKVPSYKFYREQMLLDMYPLLGQYGSIDTSRSCFSIFDVHNNKYYYQQDTTCFLDEKGVCDSVMNHSGRLVPPWELNPDEFIANFKPSWAEKLLPLHPEYNLLVQYERFSASHVFDDDYEKTDTYADALAKGYLNPTHSTTPPTNRFTFDPHDPLYSYSFASSAKEWIEDSLFQMRTSPQQITLWGFATAMAKCGEPVDSACIVKWNQSGNAFNSDSLCVGELDMAWRTFRNKYMDWKRQWIDKFIHDNAGSPKPYQPCTEVFVNRDSLLNINGFTPSGIQSNQNTGTDSLNEFYAANCEAYRERWKEQLGDCYNDVQRDSIITELINVCKEGADATHPFGASTVKPQSSYQYKSFESVIVYYNGRWGITDTTCNSYRIDKPLPYDQQMFFTDQSVWNKPDTCTCSRIGILYTQYQLNSTHFSSFSDYISQTLHTSISNAALDSLRGLCNGTITCKYLTTPIVIPAPLQCSITNTCISCLEFKQAYDLFSFKFPSISPTMVASDTLQQIKNHIFENYMNNRFGFTKSTQEYLSFKDECDSAGLIGSPPDTSFSCVNFEKLATGFQNYYTRITSGTLPQAFDSGGCNVTNWTINEGAWTHNYKYKWSDFLNGGIVKQPVNDTLDLHTNYNYVNDGLCIDSGFAVSFRVRFPIDSARKATYVRHGGIAEDYGGITFNINTSVQHLYVNSQRQYRYVYPQYIQAMWNNPGPYYPGNISFSLDDSALLIDYSDWKTIKFKFAKGHDTIFLDGTPIETYANSLPLGYLNQIAAIAHGYDLEIDWMKIYDSKDSVRYMQDFNSCNWGTPDFGTSCVYNCQEQFTDYVNSNLFSNYTTTEVQNKLTSCGISAVPCNVPGLLLCEKNKAMNEELNINPNPCADSTDFAIMAATQLYQIYHDSLSNQFNESYTKTCLNVASLESLTVSKPVSEYHYTLYYYDQAGNLVKTIPPEGVKPNRSASWLADVREKRAIGDTLKPQHQLPTVYRYNSLNQVVSQKSPDGGRSEFWYDRLGRLAVSRNAKQRANSRFSYTIYDAIGRIVEVGQKRNPISMAQTTSRDPILLKKWIEFHNYEDAYWPEQVTRTAYDVPSTFASTYVGLTPFSQKSYTLRNRVSRVMYYDYLEEYGPTIEGTDTTYYPQYDWFYTATEYSYDIHGNVDSMLNIGWAQSMMASSLYGSNAFKLISYKYDLLSGKVNEVHYQPGFSDEFYHRYEYDADNRLTDVYTADNKAYLHQRGLEEHQAHYEYYKHGPLARLVIGQQQVQGLDYAYTLQGWLKGVNSTALNVDHDMGQDGKIGESNSNVARDAYGFNLNYFTQDYFAVNDGVTPFPSHTGFMPGGTCKPLYNGNISSMAVNIGKFSQPQLYNYGYDQLNRITKMDVYRGFSDANNNWNSLAATNDYKERVSYDGNGNILKYLRQGYGSNLNMDSLSYNYNEGTNQLNYVADRISGSTSHGTNYTEDIDNQNPDNYRYDEIGNLIRDSTNKLTGIFWNVYGKIISIQRQVENEGDAGEVIYQYDPSGNRVGKINWRYAAVPQRDWYVRDAQGNVMAVYQMTHNPDYSFGKLRLKEHHIYGSSRLGVINRDINVGDSLIYRVPRVSESLIGYTWLYQTERGKTTYELNNHLGNVLVTVSDKHNGHVNGSSYDYYTADVINANDYYPFGMIMPGRKYSAGNLYRYGFNGKENDSEIKGEGNEQDYGMRIYDPRLGKFLSVDPLTKDYPWYTPYQFAGNMPIRAIDLDGGEPKGYEANNPYGASHPGTNVKYIPSSYDNEGYNVKFDGADMGLMKIYAVEDIDKRTYLIYETATGAKKSQWFVEYDKNGWKGGPEHFNWNAPPNSADEITAITVLPLVLVPAVVAYGPALVKKIYETAKEHLDKNSKSNDNNSHSDQTPSEPKYVYGKYGPNYYENGEKIREDLGIPKEWEIRPAKKDEGVRFLDPENPQENNIRVMPGRSDSEFPNSQNPYVIRYKNGSPVGADGKVIPNPSGTQQNKAEEIHVPLEKFKF
jgi:RHS repeat-associated protein